MAKTALKKITDAESEGKALKAAAFENAKKILASNVLECERIASEKLEAISNEAKKIADDSAAKCRMVIDEATDKARLQGEALKKIIEKNREKTIDCLVKLLLG